LKSLLGLLEVQVVTDPRDYRPLHSRLTGINLPGMQIYDELGACFLKLPQEDPRNGVGKEAKVPSSSDRELNAA
jgi:hypothetical protein